MSPIAKDATFYTIEHDELYAYQIEKSDDGLIFYTRYFGELSLEVLLESSKVRMSDSDHKDAVFVVADIQHADASKMATEDVHVMAAHVRQVLTERPNLVAIAVATDPLSYGLSRVWYGATKSASDNLYVVSSEDAALEVINRIRTQRGL